MIVVSSGGDRVEDLKKIGAVHITMDISTKSVLSYKLLSAFLPLKKVIENEKIDIIHAHTRTTQWLACLITRMIGVPFISTCHGFFRPRFFRRFMPCWGKKVIAISEQVRDHLINDFGVKPGMIVTVRNGIDLKSFAPVDDQSRKNYQRQAGFNGEKVVGIIARLSDVKGHHVLIDAMKIVQDSISDVKLFIVGTGKEEQRLKSQVKRLGLCDVIFFHPVVNQTADFFRMFDCFVMPSLKEGLGLSVMEAQAAGLPVIASRTGGIPSLIEDGITGMLVEPGKPDMLAEKIVQLLGDERLLKELGSNARKKAEAEYGAEKMAEKIVKVYKETLGHYDTRH